MREAPLRSVEVWNTWNIKLKKTTIFEKNPIFLLRSSMTQPEKLEFGARSLASYNLLCNWQNLKPEDEGGVTRHHHREDENLRLLWTTNAPYSSRS